MKDNSPVFVAAGADRFEVLHQAFGLKPIDFKVSAEDSGGGLFIVEHTSSRPGGPPRHIHHDQEEWFYVLEGNYVIEVGDTTYRLGAGDAVLAPRAIAHVWAFVGSGHGRLLITFQPAGQMEDFFVASSELDTLPPPAELAALFAKHGMRLVGPPLPVD